MTGVGGYVGGCHQPLDVPRVVCCPSARKQGPEKEKKRTKKDREKPAKKPSPQNSERHDVRSYSQIVPFSFLLLLAYVKKSHTPALPYPHPPTTIHQPWFNQLLHTPPSLLIGRLLLRRLLLRRPPRLDEGQAQVRHRLGLVHLIQGVVRVSD